MSETRPGSDLREWREKALGAITRRKTLAAPRLAAFFRRPRLDSEACEAVYGARCDAVHARVVNWITWPLTLAACIVLVYGRLSLALMLALFVFMVMWSLVFDPYFHALLAWRSHRKEIVSREPERRAIRRFLQALGKFLSCSDTSTQVDFAGEIAEWNADRLFWLQIRDELSKLGDEASASLRESLDGWIEDCQMLEHRAVRIDEARASFFRAAEQANVALIAAFTDDGSETCDDDSRMKLLDQVPIAGDMLLAELDEPEDWIESDSEDAQDDDAPSELAPDEPPVAETPVHVRARHARRLDQFERLTSSRDTIEAVLGGVCETLYYADTLLRSHLS